MKYIHIECLQHWLDSKRVAKETDYVNSYFWKNIICELCKNVFPDTVKYKNQVIKVLNYKLPETGPYLVLETYTSMKSKARIIHVAKFGKF